MAEDVKNDDPFGEKNFEYDDIHYNSNGEIQFKINDSIHDNGKNGTSYNLNNKLKLKVLKFEFCTHIGDKAIRALL